MPLRPSCHRNIADEIVSQNRIVSGADINTVSSLSVCVGINYALNIILLNGCSAARIFDAIDGCCTVCRDIRYGVSDNIVAGCDRAAAVANTVWGKGPVVSVIPRLDTVLSETVVLTVPVASQIPVSFSPSILLKFPMMLLLTVAPSAPWTYKPTFLIAFAPVCIHFVLRDQQAVAVARQNRRIRKDTDKRFLNVVVLNGDVIECSGSSGIILNNHRRTRIDTVDDNTIL